MNEVAIALIYGAGAVVLLYHSSGLSGMKNIDRVLIGATLGIYIAMWMRIDG